MTTRLTLAALLTSLPAALAAQSANNTSGVVRPQTTPDPITASAASTRRAVVCDESEFRRNRVRHVVGGGIALGALAGTIVASEQNARVGLSDPSRGGEVLRRQGVIIGVGLPLFLGALAYGDAQLSTRFWERAIANLKIGETRSADVRACLREPRATTSSGTEEQWTYAWQHRDRLNTVSLTFKDSVLAGVRRSQVRVSGRHESAATVPPDIIPILPVHTDSLPPR